MPEAAPANGVTDTLLSYLGRAVPPQLVPDLLGDVVAEHCGRLGLPAPVVVAGNLVVGDLGAARIVLSAHLDEAWFSLVEVRDGFAALQPCHRPGDDVDRVEVEFVGIRDQAPVRFGRVVAQRTAQSTYVCTPPADLRVGDRAVYVHAPDVDGHVLVGAAIDDRVGAVVALEASALVSAAGVPVAVVLSDGEQQDPDGYFSRTFPHVLPTLRHDARLVFVDGMFQDGLEREGLTGPDPAALVVAHTGDGRGYSVPPRLFAHLRDDVVPRARAAGIDVRLSSAYHSRGDDWGLVTNPTSGADHEAFFVSFGGWGRLPSSRTLDLRAVESCVRFAAFAAVEVARLGTGPQRQPAGARA